MEARTDAEESEYSRNAVRSSSNLCLSIMLTVSWTVLQPRNFYVVDSWLQPDRSAHDDWQNCHTLSNRRAAQLNAFYVWNFP